MNLAILRCADCGAPLPLSDDASLRCAACGETTEVPPDYAALRAYATSARETRRRAERVYRLLDATSISPKAAERFGKFGIPAMVFGIPGLLWATQGLCHWQPRTWVVFGVFGPLLVGCLVFAALVARTNPTSYVQVIGGRIRPGAPLPSGEPTCGACGAPLAPEPDALSATCDYCLSDSWLSDVSEEHVAGTARERANLVDLVNAAKFQFYELGLFLGLCLLIPGGFLLWLWIGFSR